MTGGKNSIFNQGMTMVANHIPTSLVTILGTNDGSAAMGVVLLLQGIDHLGLEEIGLLALQWFLNPIRPPKMVDGF